jgi:hypothetical protein
LTSRLPRKSCHNIHVTKPGLQLLFWPSTVDYKWLANRYKL